MGEFIDYDQCSPADLFCLGFVGAGFGVSAAGLVLLSPAIALFGGLMTAVGLAYFWMNE